MMKGMHCVCTIAKVAGVQTQQLIHKCLGWNKKTFYVNSSHKLLVILFLYNRPHTVINHSFKTPFALITDGNNGSVVLQVKLIQ